MAKNVLGKVPFPPLVKVETDTPLSVQRISDLLASRMEGVSFCVRSSSGHANRGGYFFHVVPNGPDLGACQVLGFDKTLAATLPVDELAALVNHCAGLQFDEQSFLLCQTQINFRVDPEPPAEAAEEEDLEDA